DAAEPITSDTIGDYIVPQDRVQEVSNVLERLGLKVVQKGVTSISVEGELETFDEVFQCDLELESKQTMEGIEREEPYYSPRRTPRVPEELTQFVAVVTFPEPPELFP
ncbi:MAG: hypothetical protein ACE5Q6_14130, partial [Dehalococcoidia bacterium]